jgi:hypothetical protein
MRYFIVLAVMLLQASLASGQRFDKCHAYVVDVLLAQKLVKELNNAKAADQPNIEAKYENVEIDFPFEAAVAEEMETTKHFPFPHSKLFITASVYYTDEIMNSQTGRDSITLGIFVSPNKPETAIGPQIVGNAVADVAYNRLTSKVRVKHHVVVNGRRYVVGLECEPKIAVATAEEKK